VKYDLLTPELEKEIADDPSAYVFLERDRPCRYTVSTLDVTRKYPKTLIAADFDSFDAKGRTIVFLNDPEYDIIVSRVCGDQPFLYPDDERDFDLLRVLQCTEIITETDTFQWDAPGMWYNKDSERTNFWSRSTQ
jgi:hypothetical protein